MKKKFTASTQKSSERTSNQVAQDCSPTKIQKNDSKTCENQVLKAIDLNCSAKQEQREECLSSIAEDVDPLEDLDHLSQSNMQHFPNGNKSVVENQENKDDDMLGLEWNNNSGVAGSEIVDFTNASCKNDFEVNVMFCLLQLEKNQQSMVENQMAIQQNQKETKALLNSLSKSNAKSDLMCFEDKHQLDLPFKTLQDFVLFSDTLLTDVSLKKDMLESFKTCLDEDLSLTRTMVRIMRKFISKEVVLKFTAVRSAREGEKTIFFKLQFCKCMCGFVKTEREFKFEDEVGSEQNLEDALSEVFTNVKKWT